MGYIVIDVSCLKQQLQCGDHAGRVDALKEMCLGEEWRKSEKFMRSGVHSPVPVNSSLSRQGEISPSRK